MTEYQTTNTPPIVRLIDGELFIEIINGEQSVRAPIGDGRRFFSQIVEKLVDPALMARYGTTAKYNGLVSAGVIYPADPDEFAAPND